MRILHLLQSPRFSGAENVVCQIIAMFKNEPTIEMAYCSKDGQIREALAEREIPFLPIRDITVPEVKRIINEYKPDIIHAHDMRASYIAAHATMRVPIISHIHNNNMDARGLSARSIAYLYAAIKSKHIFWVSDTSFSGYVFHGLIKKKSEVLYNVININDLYAKMQLDNKEYNYDIIYLGRLTRPKDPRRLLQVIRGIANRKPDVRVAIVGTGEMEADVKREARELDLMDNISFLGFQNNPYKILHDAKLLLLTSLWEGTPMCVLEAMCLGVPVVSTPTDGVKSVTLQGVTGFLSNDDQELCEKCIRIIEESELREQLSQSSHAHAKGLMDIELYRNKILQSYLRAKLC